MPSKDNGKKKKAGKTPNPKVFNKATSTMKVDELRAYCGHYTIDIPEHADRKILQALVSTHKKSIKTMLVTPYERDLVKEEIFKEFIEYMAMTVREKIELLGLVKDKDKRYPHPTEQMFAQKFGLGKNTLTSWKRRSDFRERVDRIIMTSGIDDMPDVMDGLLRRCKSYGRGDDIELYLAFYKDWTRKQVVEHVEKWDENDIRILIQALPEDKQKQFNGFLENILTEIRKSGGITSAVKKHSS